MRKLFSFVLLLVLVCCAEDPEPQIDYTSFFPMKKGSYWTYYVTEINVQPGIDTSYLFYFQRHVITSSSMVEGDSLYTIQLSRRYKGSVNYFPFGLWSARIKQNELIVQEGNIPYVRLTFPFDERTRWDLNKYNVNSGGATPDICSIQYNDDSRIRVTEKDEPYPLVDRRYSWYEKNKGLVSRYSRREDWNYNSLGEYELTRLQEMYLSLFEIDLK
jgi:hypothetical protein